MLRRKLHKQLLTQHLKLCRALLLRCPASSCKWCESWRRLPIAVKATVTEKLGHRKTRTSCTGQNQRDTSDRMQTWFNDNSFAHQNSPSHADSRGLRMIIYIIYADRRWSLTASWPDARRKSMHPWDWSSAAWFNWTRLTFSLSSRARTDICTPVFSLISHI